MPKHLVNVVRVMVLVMIVLLLLPSCATKATPPDTVAVETTRSANIDKRLLEACRPLPKPKSSGEKDVIEFVQQSATVYRDCSDKQTGLANIVRRAFNTGN